MIRAIRLFGILIIFAACVGNSSLTQPQNLSGLSPKTNAEELVRLYFERWKNNGDSFFELLDKQVIWRVSGRSPVSGVYHGKLDFMENAVLPVLKQLTTPIKPELISLSSDSTYVWLHFKAKAITVSGTSYVNSYVWKMQFKENKIIKGVAFLDTYELSELIRTTQNSNMNRTAKDSKKYLGMWVTADGYIRQELLPNHRYDEARGDRKSAYQGRYRVDKNYIYYVDDTGFSADGEFVNDSTLHHGGYIFHKENDSF